MPLDGCLEQKKEPISPPAEEVAALERDFEAFQASDDEPGDTSGEPNSR